MDKTIKCVDCGTEFEFTESEQDFYAEKGFSEPKRCSACRAAKKAARDGGSQGGYSGGSNRGGSNDDSGRAYSGGQREYFTATCSSCGNEARVPFRPSGSKPVYCSDCFRGQRG